MAEPTPDHATELAHLPPASPPTNHGHTTAAWVTVTLVLVGAVLCSFGMIGPVPWLVVAGAVVIVVGLVAGKVLKMLGFGQPVPGSRPERHAH